VSGCPLTHCRLRPLFPRQTVCLSVRLSSQLTPLLITKQRIGVRPRDAWHHLDTIGMRISPLLLAASCASMRTPPPATMGVRAQAGKLFGQFRQKRDVTACVEMESHRVPQHTGRIRLLRTVRT